MRYIIVLLLLMPFAGFAQLQLSGRVVNATDNTPIPDASIFLNNTTSGTKAGADGKFILYNLRDGQYDIIVSVIGFEAYRKTIKISKSTTLPDIRMIAKTMMLKTVQIGEDPKRTRKLRIFKDQFLGRSAFADQCTILNPEVLYLRFSKGEKVLKGNTDDFLEIVNDALGYKLKYLVSSFVLDKEAMSVRYEGSVLFEESTGKSADIARWAKNRREVYLGSPTHFLREILATRVDSDFMVRPFCIKRIDTNKIIPMNPGDIVYDKAIVYDTLHAENYVHLTDKPGVYAITYSSDLDVFYYKPRQTHSMVAVGGREWGNRGQVGNIIFLDPNLYFDINGTILNPTGTMSKYKWGASRVAQLLPIDYWPEVLEDDKLRLGKTK